MFPDEPTNVERCCCYSSLLFDAAHANILHKEMNRSVSNLHNVDLHFNQLLSFTDDWDALRTDDNEVPLRQLHELIYYYAVEVYGRNDIKMWLKSNQDKSVLDYVNGSDLAFAMLVYDNYHPKWVHEIEERRKSDMLQQELQQDRNASSAGDEVKWRARELTNKKRKRYTGPDLRYTHPPTHKKGYLESGWKPEGMQRFQSLTSAFDQLVGDKESWTLCKESWDCYIRDRKEVEGNDCWVPIYEKISDEDEDGGGEGDDSEAGKFDFVLKESPYYEVGGMTGGIEVPQVFMS